MENLFGNTIHMYTREQALEDGILIDVTKNSEKLGIKVPVAITAALWSEINNIPEKFSFQSPEYRLSEVLFMLKINIIRYGDESQINYKTGIEHEIETNNGKILKELEVKAVIGLGDNHETVMTIMLPNED